MMDAAIAQTPPPVSVTLALDPTILKEDEAIELSATIVSQASFPITILAYSTIFDIREAQRRSRPGADYQCVDVDTNTPVRLQDRICGRFDNISHKLDDSDSQYFHRLQPAVPYKFSGHCILLCRELVPGHKYRLSVDEEANMGWWRYGKKEEVLESAEQKLPQYMFWPSGDPVDLTSTQPVEFTVPTNWTNIGASVSADTSGMVPPRYKKEIRVAFDHCNACFRYPETLRRPCNGALHYGSVTCLDAHHHMYLVDHLLHKRHTAVRTRLWDLRSDPSEDRYIDTDGGDLPFPGPPDHSPNGQILPHSPP